MDCSTRFVNWVSSPVELIRDHTLSPTVKVLSSVASMLTRGLIERINVHAARGLGGGYHDSGIALPFLYARTIAFIAPKLRNEGFVDISMARSNLGHDNKNAEMSQWVQEKLLLPAIEMGKNESKTSHAL